MFKSHKQTLAQQLKSKFSFSLGHENPPPKPMPVSKKLPPEPTPDEELLMKESLKEKLLPSNENLHNENIKSYGPFFLEYSIAAEFNHVKKTRLPGVYVIPSAKDPLVWFGVLFIRQGIYQDGVFRFSIFIPSNYPDGDCPSVIFKPPVYHPFINATTGVLDIERAFSSWRPNVNHLWQVLLHLRRIFYKFDSKDPVNKQAAELFDKDLIAYEKKVKEEIEYINNFLYDNEDNTDPHAIRFTEWNPDIHEELRSSIVRQQTEMVDIIDEDFSKPRLSGLSYIEPGTPLIFSKERMKIYYN
ncbi:protein AKTIP homolog isoform X3 [Hydra vulgaris]|uniref:Protein AKTIP homolog isoform X3 n=2 Tax=Hydra vulgaris TaxID=6087 RepID=A0ABM4DQF5_HYDVU